MADEIEIVKTERAAAPDGAEWMDQPPAGVQPDDFVCGLRRGGYRSRAVAGRRCRLGGDRGQRSDIPALAARRGGGHVRLAGR